MRYVTVLFALSLSSCSATAPVPPFDVEVSLTEVAQRYVDAAGETIVVSICFDGDGTPRPGEHTAPFREVFLGCHDVELRRPGRVRISDASVSKEAIGRLSDPNYYWFVNCVSGRRAVDHNFLSGYMSGRASDLSVAKPIAVRCGLP